MLSVPAKTMFVVGIRFVFDEVAITTRLESAVSPSPTAKGIGGVAVLNGVA